MSDGCLQAFARNAIGAVARTCQSGEPYRTCLQRHIEARARFVLLWTSTDETFERQIWGELVGIAQQYALPRSPKLVQPVVTDAPHSRQNAVPEFLVARTRQS